MQAVGSGQASAGKETSCVGGSWGVGWMCQAVPFQRSARIIPPELVNVNPTAVQAAGAEHATPFSRPPPDGVGAGWMCQAVPFQRSTRLPRSDPPTATQADGPVQATPPREANWTFAGLGVDWMVQVDPSHRSARVC